MQRLLDTEPLAVGEAVKVLIVWGVLSVPVTMPAVVQLAVVSVAMAAIARLQRAKVWSPAGVDRAARQAWRDGYRAASGKRS